MNLDWITLTLSLMCKKLIYTIKNLFSYQQGPQITPEYISELGGKQVKW